MIRFDRLLRPFGARNDTGWASGARNDTGWASGARNDVRRRREDRLLLSLIKESPSLTGPDEAAYSGIDWDYLIEDSIREGVFYPFYRTLTALDAARDAIPPEFKDKFRQVYLSHIAQSENFYTQATTLLERLDALNVPAIVFKGPAVDSLIYDGFYRPRLDLDIVVDEKDVPVVKNKFDAGGPLKVHIHGHLINNTWLSADDTLAAVDTKKIREETAPFKGCKNIVMLRPEINVLFLCEHAVKHGVGQLVSLYEIDRLIRFYGARLDWRKFTALAEEFGLGRIAYYGIYFTKEILYGDIPDETLSILKPERLTAGERGFIVNVLNRRAGGYSAFCVYLAARKGVINKARFLLQLAFPHLRRLVLP